MTTFSSPQKRRQRALLHIRAFTQKRAREQPLELEWATCGARLPDRLPVPPEWVRKTIIRVSETSLGPVFCAKPNDAKELHAALLRMAGMLQAQIALLESPGGLAPDDDDDLKDFTESTAKQILRSVRPKLRLFTEAIARLSEKSAPASLSQLQQNHELFRQGLHGLIDAQGDLVKGRTAKAKLYGLLWFHWSQLQGLKNAAQIHDAIEAVTEEKFSRKTIEAVCSELGIFRGRRGRPRTKKILK